MKSTTVLRITTLLAAGASLVLSVWLYFQSDKMDGIFVGVWVPSILSLGAFLVASGPRRS